MIHTGIGVYILRAVNREWVYCSLLSVPHDRLVVGPVSELRGYGKEVSSLLSATVRHAGVSFCRQG